MSASAVEQTSAHQGGISPLYLDVRGEPMLGLFHAARGDGPAVLLCPPFGREDAASYRSRRAWACSLASAGMPVLRVDLPGTGDSGGRIDDPERFQSWLEAVAAATRYLREETHRSRVAAIGIGLGGFLAVAAAAQGAPIDDLVLWGVPARGRAIARELSTFARIESDSIVAAGGPESPSPGSPAAIAPGGFLVPPETLDELGKIDLTLLRLPPADGRRALLLERDGIAPDDALRRMLEESAVAVEVAGGQGYGTMMTVLPETARLPHAVEEHVQAWLRVEGHRGRVPQPSPEPAARSSPLAEISVGDVEVRETPFEVTHDGTLLFGILAEPVAAPPGGLTLVLLNAGAIRRTGPSRLWVEIARRWAARGVSTLRIDLEGIGDASGDDGRHLTIADLYAVDYVGHVRAVLEALTARTGQRRFALLGLCAGAYWSFHTALVDDRVSLVVMLNPRLLFWNPEIVDERDARNRRSRIFRTDAWRQLTATGWRALPRQALTRALRVAAEPLRLRARRRAHVAAGAATEAALDQLEASRTRTVFAFCDGEPLRDELTANGLLANTDKRPHIEFVLLPGRDHVLRPLWMHEHVHAAVDRALASELERMQADARA
jgi:alpha-beta hydrolase superfamily lysophospholipase